QAYVFVQAQGALSASEQADLVKRAEAAIADLDGITALSTRSGVSGNGGMMDASGGMPADTIGQILMDLKTTADGPYNGRETLEVVRERLSNVPALRFQISAREQGPPGGKDIQVALLGLGNDELYQSADMIRGWLEARDDVREIDD